MSVQERNIYALWSGKQSAKGTPNDSPTHRFIQVGGGGFNAPREDGSENWSDMSKFGSQTDWVNNLVGQGAPPIEATPNELAYLMWLFTGAEVVTDITGPPAKKNHHFEPTAGAGFWSTWFHRIGSSVITRHKYVDCRISQLVIEGSTANKAVRVTPTMLSVDPGIIYTSDPAAAIPTNHRPFLYTDGVGTFTIDGEVFTGQSQFNITLNEDLQLIYGDDISAEDMMVGNASASLGVTIYMNADGLAQYNKLVYGSATPTAETKPSRNIAALGSYGFDLTSADQAGDPTGDEFHFLAEGVKWNIPPAPDADPAGGVPELPLAGGIRLNASNPLYEMDVACDAAEFTA